MNYFTEYRSHTCGALRAANVGQIVRLSGWASVIRNLGHLIFIDLRDRYGITQCVIESSHPVFPIAAGLNHEDVIQIEGEIVQRSTGTRNPVLATGEIEVNIKELTVLNRTKLLPFPVNSEDETSEELRLRYRYLEMRREKLRENLILRARMINAFRLKLSAVGFIEIQTPILTCPSPEGARDFLVPSRLHPGKVFALPQSPQQFKQLLMIGGFDRYFQIAPCFRDEAARADRSPGEHYQLDLEMSFASQEDVFRTVEPILSEVFTELGRGQPVTASPFPRIKHTDAILHYGSDKPDLRNPLKIVDITPLFGREDVTFDRFKEAVAKGAVVRAILAPDCAERPRKWFDQLNHWMIGKGGAGLGYITFDRDFNGKGPLAKFLAPAALNILRDQLQASAGATVFMICDQPAVAPKLAGLARLKLGEELKLVNEEQFAFCWITDFPMYELEEESGNVDFAHNPFSMPQGGLESLLTLDPLQILAQQYDIVCNGYELCSGAVRNHVPEIMYAAFKIAGYTRQQVESQFSGLINALSFGAPPHAGCAPGVDRMVMLLTGEKNLRQVIAFPMNQQQEDLLMGAPSEVSDRQLEELNLQFKKRANPDISFS